ncbi:MAG TPA: hypothetical protein VMP01_15940 [Pirellulaceae bacterium]|nr:hypothetical protein [Pirellulaceae bacterium]
MKFSLRTLLLVTLLSGPAIWLARLQLFAYREASVASSMAELRWQEWKSIGPPATARAKVAERHARLRYTRDRNFAADKARQVLIPIALPPEP